ncbi:YhgE/Pip domain-containing protein [Microbacterium aquimaris]|nr:YhgE/Pip domain-containing protein [Microbacterium aquimaris]
MLMAELRRLTATRMSVLALIALVAVPVLYGGLYLWANQDPYGRLDQVPVALVDADTGATLNGESVDYGADVAENLLADATFGWIEMTAAAAESSLEHGEVDFIVTIPSDFSEALVSASGDDPHRARLELQTNDANNYLASTIGSQAIEQIRASVAELVGREATRQLLDGIAEIRGSIAEAADGATQLVDGTATAADGTDSLVSGAIGLDDGAAQVAGGTAQLASGSEALATGTADLAVGAAQVADGVATLDDYAARAGAASRSVVDALPAVRDDIVAELRAAGLGDDRIAAVVDELDALDGRIRSVDDTVQSAVVQVDALSAGAAQVSAGSASAAAAAAQLSDGAASVASGADALHEGTSSLLTGAGELRDGVSELLSGTVQLRDGLEEGVASLPDSDGALREAQADTISDPVTITSTNVASAEDYGAGLAPFFAALAGWIGIYALFLIVKPISRRAITALHNPVRTTLAGWLTPALLGGVQMVSLFGVLAVALGFTFANPLATLGVMVLASFVYAAIILALNVWLGSVGQFLGLVLMVLQLVTAGGTFPWQTLPGPLSWLHHLLPMGYVVDAMRQLMYGGDLTRLADDGVVLLTWMIGALVLAAIGVTRMTHRRTLRDLAPSLIG